MSRRSPRNQSSLDASVVPESPTSSTRSSRRPLRNSNNRDELVPPTRRTADRQQKPRTTRSSQAATTDATQQPEETSLQVGGEEDEEDAADEDDDSAAVLAPSERASRLRSQAGQEDGSVSSESHAMDKDSDSVADSSYSSQDEGDSSKVDDMPVDTDHKEGEGEDDDDYNAVDLISESDGEDPDIEKDEEANLIDEMTHESWAELITNEAATLREGAALPGDLPYFDEQLRRLEHSIIADDTRSESSSAGPLHSISRVPIAPPPTPTTTAGTIRRVRFDASALKSPYAASCSEHELFFPSGLAIDEQDDDCSSVGMSGYESDGETTDEEGVPVTMTKSPRDVLHQPSWTEELPSSPVMSDRSAHKYRTPRVKKPCGPRLASWTVHPHKALGQSDENGAVVVMMPHNVKQAIVAEKEADEGNATTASPVTACLRAQSSSSLLQQPSQEIPAGPTSALATSIMSASDLDPVDILPDPVLGVGTDAAMAGLLGDIVGPDDSIVSTPQHTLADFLPATDFLDELDFAVANSDQESTDLDIMDFIALTDDSSDSDADAKCIKLKSEAAEEAEEADRATMQEFAALRSASAGSPTLRAQSSQKRRLSRSGLSSRDTTAAKITKNYAGTARHGNKPNPSVQRGGPLKSALRRTSAVNNLALTRLRSTRGSPYDHSSTSMLGKKRKASGSFNSGAGHSLRRAATRLRR